MMNSAIMQEMNQSVSEGQAANHVACTNYCPNAVSNVQQERKKNYGGNGKTLEFVIPNKDANSPNINLEDEGKAGLVEMDGLFPSVNHPCEESLVNS